MSCSWGYYCVTCDTESDHWLNHGDDRLRLLADDWPAWRAAMASTSFARGEVTIDALYLGGAPLYWLAQHDGHTIWLANEYSQREPLDSTDQARSFTLRLTVSGAQRAALQAAAGLDKVPDEYAMRDWLTPRILAALDSLIAKEIPHAL